LRGCLASSAITFRAPTKTRRMSASIATAKRLRDLDEIRKVNPERTGTVSGSRGVGIRANSGMPASASLFRKCLPISTNRCDTRRYCRLLPPVRASTTGAHTSAIFLRLFHHSARYAGPAHDERRNCISNPPSLGQSHEERFMPVTTDRNPLCSAMKKYPTPHRRLASQWLLHGRNAAFGLFDRPSAVSSSPTTASSCSPIGDPRSQANRELPSGFCDQSARASTSFANRVPASMFDLLRCTHFRIGPALRCNRLRNCRSAKLTAAAFSS